MKEEIFIDNIPATFELKAQNCLDNHTTHTSGLLYMTLSTSDGYLIAHTIPSNTSADARKIAAMAATFSGIGESLALETTKVGMESTIIETAQGFIASRIIQSSDMELVLLGVFDQSSNHGIAMWSLNRATKEISNLLKSYD